MEEEGTQQTYAKWELWPAVGPVIFTFKRYDLIRLITTFPPSPRHKSAPNPRGGESGYHDSRSWSDTGLQKATMGQVW